MGIGIEVGWLVAGCGAVDGVDVTGVGAAVLETDVTDGTDVDWTVVWVACGAEDGEDLAFSDGFEAANVCDSSEIT